MCFAPQWRALFRHLNFQKCSEPDVLWHFWFEHVLRATTACTFSTRNFQKCSEHLVFWCVLTLFTSKCASCHKGVHFSISPLTSRLRARCFSERTVQPSGATKHWKNTVFCNFPTFSRTCIFSPLTVSLSDLLQLWSSPSWQLLPGCVFPSVPIVGSFASKLPWIILVVRSSFLLYFRDYLMSIRDR